MAQAYAKDDKASCAKITRTALAFGTICGIVVGALLYSVAIPLSYQYCGGFRTGISSCSVSSEMAILCAKYVSIRAIALPSVVVATIAQAVCLGSKDTKTPMISVLVAGILNFIGDLLLVNVFGMGIAGASWATALSQYAAAGMLLRVLQKRGFLEKKNEQSYRLSNREDSVATHENQGSDMSSSYETIVSLLSFIPFLFVMIIKIGMHNSCAAVAASLGGAPAAAHTVLFAVAMLCFTFGDVGSSLSQAFLPAFFKYDKGTISDESMVAVRQTLKQLLKCTLLISTTVVGLASLVLTAGKSQLTLDTAVHHQIQAVLPFLVTTLCFHGTAVTLEGLLLAQQNFLGLSWTYAAVALTMAACLCSVRYFEAGLIGIWSCYVWFQASRIMAFSVLGGLVKPKRWFKRKKAPVVNFS